MWKEPVRPIEEYLARSRHGRDVALRIWRLNRDGKPESEAPRGWHPHAKITHFALDVMSVREFVRNFGSAAYRAVPRDKLARRGHRKAVSWSWVVERFGRKRAGW